MNLTTVKPVGGLSRGEGLMAHSLNPEIEFAGFTWFERARKVTKVCVGSRYATMMTREDFIHHVTRHFPDVAARIDEDDFGNTLLELAAMKLATRDVILRDELHNVYRHFSYISYLFSHASRELKHAIRISYLEGLLLGETGEEYGRARALLPENLEWELQKSERYFAMLKWR